MSTIKTLCNSTTCIARRTCAIYRHTPSTRQQYENFNTGLGLRCPEREDINLYGMHRLRDWREVDKQLKQAKETV